MRMLSGDANPFNRKVSTSRNELYAKKASLFLRVPQTNHRNAPSAICGEEYSESNVSTLSSHSMDNSNYLDSKCGLNYDTKPMDCFRQARFQIFSRSMDSSFHVKKVDERSAVLNDVTVRSVPDFLVARANLKKSKRPDVNGSYSTLRPTESQNPIVTIRKIQNVNESRDDSENMYMLEKPDDRDSFSCFDCPMNVPTTEVFTSELSTTLSMSNNTTKYKSVKYHQKPELKEAQKSNMHSIQNFIEGNDSAKVMLNTMLLSRRHSACSVTNELRDCCDDELKHKHLSTNSTVSKASSDVKSILNTMLLSRSQNPNAQSIFRNEHKDSTSETSEKISTKSSDGDQDHSSSQIATRSFPEKYLKMIKMGVPISAVKNHMVREGVTSSNAFCELELESMPTTSVPKAKDPFRRTRLHWMPLEKFGVDSIWYQIKNDSDIHNIPIDEDEFQSLFQMKIQSPRTTYSKGKDNVNEGVVKVIDAKRANNGGIILAGLRMSFDEIVKAVNTMDESSFTVQQMKGLIEYIPTQMERQALTRFVTESSEGSIMSLSECERFMISLLPISKVQEKMSVMHFKLHFPTAIKDFDLILATLSKACDEVLLSTKLRKILGAILKIGNLLNRAGQIPQSTDTFAFALESLATLSQVKAWDKKTTLLSYISSIILRWNENTLNIKNDIPHVLKVSSLNGNDYEESLKGLLEQLNRIQRTVDMIDTNDNDVFLSEATSALNRLNNLNIHLREKFEKVLDYLAENRNVKPMELFCSLSSFCNDLESVRLLLLQKDGVGKNRISRRLC